ncbi:MAG: sigma-70 family RNA polymerase sigma factor, partial [Vulcanimicrobiaceae bacterium]
MSNDREATVRRLLPLMRAVARRIQRMVPLADRNDLIGDGSIGLIRAVDSYTSDFGVPIESYARRLIAGAMLNGLRRMDPVSERVRRCIRRAEVKRHALAQTRGGFPSYAELERDDPKLHRARTAVFRYVPLSLDAVANSGPLLASLSDEPSAALLKSLDSRELGAAITLLPERQRRILALHYDDELSLNAISRRLQISPQRVSQLHLSALARL